MVGEVVGRRRAGEEMGEEDEEGSLMTQPLIEGS